MPNPAYDSALTTGEVVIRKWWFNTNSTKNQMSLQFQQEVERPANAQQTSSLLIGLAQGQEGLGNVTRATALMSFDANIAASVLGSKEGDATMGSPVFAAENFFKVLAENAGKEFNTKLAIQVTENFAKNPYAKKQSPKINPQSGEIIKSLNPETGTEMPVYRHTELVDAATCEHTFIVPTRATAQTETPAAAAISPIAAFGEIAS